jgi:hypothetical protein
MSLPPYTPQTKGELLEVHAVLFLSAPDNFLQVPNALPEEYRTLESTIAELHRGVDHVYRKPRCAEARARLHEVIDATYAEFKVGRVHEGRMMCHQIEDLIDETGP